MSIARAALNVSAVAWNRTAKACRHLVRRIRRTAKHADEARKAVRAQAVGTAVAGRHGANAMYTGAVRTSRYWARVASRTLPLVRSDVAVRSELWRAARGSGPIIVGPWLSEVGYEVLYWIPFVRWFVDHYRVDRTRLVVVSRGGAAGWYADLTDRYVELFDVFPSAEFAARNAARQVADQKQHGVSAFDEEILRRVRDEIGADATVCHPSAMFRLLRQFWLGNQSLDYALGYLRYRRVAPPQGPMPSLPDRFVAAKFYTGMSLPDTPDVRAALRGLVGRIASRSPVVMLDTGLTVDEHEDYTFRDIPGVVTLPSMEPQKNLAIQTDVIRRASRFVSTCGSLAWLAPMLGTETVAVYADDHLLSPHLYAARHAYDIIHAARFVPLDLAALATVDATDLSRV